MPDDRLFHKRLGHSVKVNSLSSDEEIVWRTYIQAADDFGVMRFAALPLQDQHDRLAKLRQTQILRMLERVHSVGLIQTFEHQHHTYCYQFDWQDWQKIRYAMATVHPRIPAHLLTHCTLATQWLHTLWPGGGGRNNKLKTWQPKKTWIPPVWAGNGSGNGASGSGNGSSTSRVRSDRPIPIPIKSTQLEPVPPIRVLTYFQKDQPPPARRDFHTVENSDDHDDAERANPTAVPQPHPAARTSAGSVQTPLRDRASGDDGGPVDRPGRVAGANQGHAGASGISVSESAALTHERDGSGGDGPREREQSSTVAVAAPDSNADADGVRAAIADGSEVPVGEGRRALLATIAELRATYHTRHTTDERRMDLNGRDRCRPDSDTPSADAPGTDRRMADDAAANTPEANADRLDAPAVKAVRR